MSAAIKNGHRLDSTMESDARLDSFVNIYVSEARAIVQLLLSDGENRGFVTNHDDVLLALFALHRILERLQHVAEELRA